MDFDPSAPPADEPLADPAEAELQKRLAEARALLDQFRPVTKPGRFLEPDAIAAAALLREHDLLYAYHLQEELRPHKVLRIWERATAAAGKAMAEGQQRIAEKTRLVAIAIDLLELWHDKARVAWCWPKEHGPGCAGGCRARRRGFTCCVPMASVTRSRLRMGAGSRRRQASRRSPRRWTSSSDRSTGPTPSRARTPVGGDAKRVVIDLCNDDYTVIVVTTEGWRIVKPSPIPMRRVDGMYPLPDAGVAGWATH